MSPSAEWGYPTVWDLEYFRAFERTLTMAWQRDGMVPDVLRISGREMIRLEVNPVIFSSWGTPNFMVLEFYTAST